MVVITGSIGVCAGNEIADNVQFKSFVNNKLAYVNVFFNQESRAKFMEGRLWQLDRGAEIVAATGAQPIYSVPFPGPAATEAAKVAAGEYEYELKDLFSRMLVKHPTGRIGIRPPWEGNLAASFQTLSAVGIPVVWLRGWRYMAMLAKITSSRFDVIWCPNVGTQNLDPEVLYPWAELADVFAQDVYIPDQEWVDDGLWNWYKSGDPRGCDWLVNLAIKKGKKIAWTEWGVESDRHIAMFSDMCDYVKSIPNLHHHCIWNREDGPIKGKISAGAAGPRPLMAQVYREKFVL